MSLSVDKIKQAVDSAFLAAGQLIIEFTVTDKTKVFDPTTNSMTGADTTKTVTGFYSRDKSQYGERQNVIDGERIVYLHSEDSTGALYEPKQGDVLVDSKGRRNTVRRVMETIAGSDTVLNKLVCDS